MLVKVSRPKNRLRRVLWVGLIVLAMVGIGVAVRRELELTGLVQSIVNPKFGPFDAVINERAVLTWFHIVPGSLYLLIVRFSWWRGCEGAIPVCIAGLDGWRSGWVW